MRLVDLDLEKVQSIVLCSDTPNSGNVSYEYPGYLSGTAHYKVCEQLPINYKIYYFKTFGWKRLIAFEKASDKLRVFVFSFAHLIEGYCVARHRWWINLK